MHPAHNSLTGAHVPYTETEPTTYFCENTEQHQPTLKKWHRNNTKQQGTITTFMHPLFVSFTATIAI